MKRILVAVLVALLALTPGCGKRDEGTPKTESGVAEEKTEEELREEKELAAITESELVVPEKVAALSKNAAAMWQLVGGEVSVGVEEADGVPKDGICGSEDEPDIEAVLLQEPDLILIDEVAENYEDMVSLLDMTEGAPSYMSIKITCFDDYADTMLELAKYTKAAEAYQTCVIDVRKKNAEIIASGRDALSVLIQTMPVPENNLSDESTVMQVSGEAEPVTGTDSMSENVPGTSTDSVTDSSAESVPADSEKVAAQREAITVLLMRVDEDGCTIRCNDDYVSGMLADFGLINVNQGYEDVRVELPKEEDESAAQEAGAEEQTGAEGDTAAGNDSAVQGTAAEEQASAEGDTAAGTDSAVQGTAAEEQASAEGDAAAGTDSTVQGTVSEEQTGAEGDIVAGTDSAVQEAASGAGTDEAGAENQINAEETAGAGTESAEQASSEENASTEAADEEKTSDAVKTEEQKAEEQKAEEQKAEEQTVGEQETDTQKAAEALFEKILRRNPDYIYVIYEGKERTAEKTYKEICESLEFWDEMTAVQNRHVYTLPQSTFATPPNEQWDLAYEYLYQMMFVM